MNTKLHALTDRNGKPLHFFISAGQASDYTKAAALLSSFPEADYLLAERGYDDDWFRYALKNNGITPSIPGRKSRGTPVKYDQRRYRRRSRIEMMFGRLKDRRRVATRYGVVSQISEDSVCCLSMLRCRHALSIQTALQDQ